MPGTQFSISTRSDKEVIDITSRIEKYLAEAGVREGICNVFVAHTTAALAAGEAIEGTDEDLSELLTRIIPKMPFRHEHDPSHAPDHMVSSLLGPSLTVPIRKGRIQLGTWQRILLVERNGPRERTIFVTAISAA